MTTLTVVNSTSTLPIPSQYVEPVISVYFRVVCHVVLTLASILGNSIVIRTIIVIPHRKPLTYVVVANLALAELVGTLMVPFIVVYDEVNTWVFGTFLCHVTISCQVLACFVVTWTIAVISMLRFRTMFHLKQSRFSAVRRCILILALWSIAAGFSGPFFVFSELVKSPYDEKSYWCVVLFGGDALQDFPSPSLRRFLMVRFVINFLVPAVAMLIFYGAMVVRLKYHMTRVQQITVSYPLKVKPTPRPKLPSPLPEPDSQPSIETQSLQVNRDSNQEPIQASPPELVETLLLELDQDLLRMIYVIGAIFGVCYLPYQAFYLLEYFGVLSYGSWNYFHITRRYVFLVTCLPSALHPMCYGTISQFYAKAFSLIFLCKCFKK